MAYLWVKRYSRFGRVPISAVPKRHFGHWITKLKSVGFLTQVDGFYILIGYHRAWEILGIKKTRIGYRFRKLRDYSTWSEFKKKNIEDLQGFQTERKKSQFRRRLNGSSPQGVDHCPLYSCEGVAKLFGYKSRVSGSKYRERFFDIVEEPLRLRKRLTVDQLPYFFYECKRIRLGVIYHDVK